MITDEKLLRPYIRGKELPFDLADLQGVSTYMNGQEGVFYRLKDGRTITLEAPEKPVEAV